MHHSLRVAIRLIMWLFALVALVSAQIPSIPSISPTNSSSPTSSNSDLISNLTKELNITPQQATGGAGAIFGLAKSRLNPADFSKIAGAVPGMDGLLKAAPAAKGGSSLLDSVSSAVPSNVGGLASLAGPFKSLGLSPGMATKFVPVIGSYLQSKGGSGLASLLTGALK